MSYRRQSLVINQNRYLDNRLTDFTNVPMHTLDLRVRRNANIAGDLIVGGNLTVSGDMYATNFHATGNFYLDNYVLVPAGTIIMSAAVNEPAGWLQCDGRLLAKIDYPDLWFAIMNTYTDISSGTHFKIPDLQGRCAVGSGSGTGLTARSLGTSGGEETHQLSVNEMPGHTHSGTTDTNGSHAHSINDPGHTHTQTTVNDDFNNSGANPPGFTADSAGTQTWSNISTSTTGITINSNGSHTHTFTTGSTGSGLAHNVMQPFMVVRYLIKY
jgi:microcystin-dependent protein